MSATDLLQTTQFLIDVSGKKKAVVLDFAVWEKLLTLLEDVEDAEEIRRLRKTKQAAVPWEQAQAELRAGGVNV